MALLHADNFNAYGTSTSFLFNGVYAGYLGDSPGTILADPDRISTADVLKTTSGSGDRGLRWVLPTAQNTVGIARRLWMDTLPTDTTAPVYASALVCDWRDGSNNRIASLWVTTTGGLVVSAGGLTGTILGQSIGPVISANGWYHIEAKYTIGAGTGACEVRVEGVSVINVTGLNVGAVQVAQIGFGNISSGAGVGGLPCYIKDLVIWDGSGTQNNDFLGSVLVYELKTTSDVSFPTGWTSTDANGFSVLDNNPPDDTGHYISANQTPPAAALFGLTDLPTDITSVKGLITRVRAAKSDGGDGQLKVSMHSGASDDDGQDRPITTTQTYWNDVSELDPATAAAWTPTSVNASELKLTRTL